MWLCLFRSDFVADCFQVSYRPLLFSSSSWKKVLKRNYGVSTISRTRKRFPNGTLVKSRQECENKRKVGENTLWLSNRKGSTMYFKSWRDELNRGNLGTNISSMWSNSRQHIHCLMCWLFQFLEKLRRYKFVFVPNCQHLLRLYCPMFQFRFRVRKHMVQTTCHSNHITVYNGWAQWRHNMAAVLPNMDIGHPRWRISNWSKTGMFLLIPQSLSANLQNDLER